MFCVYPLLPRWRGVVLELEQISQEIRIRSPLLPPPFKSQKLHPPVPRCKPAVTNKKKPNNLEWVEPDVFPNSLRPQLPFGDQDDPSAS